MSIRLLRFFTEKTLYREEYYQRHGTAQKNGKEKVSAKKLLTKTELQRFHPKPQQVLEYALEQEIFALNGTKVGGSRTAAE